MSKAHRVEIVFFWLIRNGASSIIVILEKKVEQDADMCQIIYYSIHLCAKKWIH